MIDIRFFTQLNKQNYFTTFLYLFHSPIAGGRDEICVGCSLAVVGGEQFGTRRHN